MHSSRVPATSRRLVDDSAVGHAQREMGAAGILGLIAIGQRDGTRLEAVGAVAEHRDAIGAALAELRAGGTELFKLQREAAVLLKVAQLRLLHTLQRAYCV